MLEQGRTRAAYTTAARWCTTSFIYIFSTFTLQVIPDVTLELDISYMVSSGLLQKVNEYNSSHGLTQVSIKSITGMRASVTSGRCTAIYTCVFNTVPDVTIEVSEHMLTEKTDKRAIAEYRYEHLTHANCLHLELQVEKQH